ncbi:MAG: TetR/AcrR family transcriptional regulator [Desulfamplus sp.]|nr:TetR/AcrR family transcriptional regulator [Desulfamplus sp.]
MMTLSRKERDDQRRREDILDAALSIFASQGFHGTTMAHISQESQYPLGTIYKYFPSKKQIYHDLVMERVHQLGKIFWEIRSREDLCAIDKLRESFMAKVVFYKKNSDFIKIYISERSTIDAVMIPKLNEKVNRMHEKEIVLFQKIFEEGGDVFKNYPSREMALLFSEITHSVAWASLFENSIPDNGNPLPGNRVAMVFDMFINGVVNQIN